MLPHPVAGAEDRWGGTAGSDSTPVLGFACRQNGIYEQAIAEYQKRAAPGSSGSEELGQAYALSGRRSEALKELDRLINT